MSDLNQPRIILITGIMASGKSSVAQALAERLPRSVHMRGDIFRRMIVNGRREMTTDYDAEALAQLHLRYQVAATVTHAYCAAGFTVVYQDVIIGAVLREVVDRLRGAYRLHVIVLCPSPEVAAARDAARHKVAYGDWTPHALDHELRTNTPRLGLWLDTSALSLLQTVDTIGTRLEEAAV